MVKILEVVSAMQNPALQKGLNFEAERFSVGGLGNLTLGDALEISAIWFRSNAEWLEGGWNRSPHLMIQPEGLSPEGVAYGPISAFNIALDYIEGNE